MYLFGSTFAFLSFFSQPHVLTFQQWTMHLCTVYGSHELHFSTTFSLKMGPTILFTHLKIILLQCFHILVFSFSKISSIQTDSMSLYIILREQLMSSASEHWTRCDADTCPRLDTCPYPNGSSVHWSLDRSPTLILTTQRNSLRYYCPNKWYQILGIVWRRWQGV